MMRNIAAIVSLFGAFLLFSTVYAEQPTTLRLGTPQGEFEDFGWGPRLGDVSVEARNVGSVAARNVQVVAKLPNGKSLQLRGPGSIAPNKSAVYSRYSGALVTNDKKIQATITCDNCR